VFGDGIAERLERRGIDEEECRGEMPKTGTVSGSLAAASPDAPERSSLRPRALYPVLSPITARSLSRGREEAAERPGGGGGQRKPFNQRHSNRGGGCSTPLPVSPTPTGRFSIDTVPREEVVSPRPHLTLPEDLVSVPEHCIRCYRQLLPAPSGGGGRRPRSGREVGVGRRILFNQICRRQGRGEPSPPPPSPSAPPPRGDIT